jgi:hypothetical protein
MLTEIFQIFYNFYATPGLARAQLTPFKIFETLLDSSMTSAKLCNQARKLDKGKTHSKNLLQPFRAVTRQVKGCGFKARQKS